VLYNPSVPLIERVCKLDFLPLKKIKIQGIVNGDQFSVNLLVGKATTGAFNNALHMSAKISEGKLIFNRVLNGQWLQEERIDSCPFAVGQPFGITIKCKREGFAIRINHTEVHKMAYREHKLEQITHLYIEGEVRLSQVYFTAEPKGQ